MSCQEMAQGDTAQSGPIADQSVASYAPGLTEGVG
jgi:hypothetical protein